MKVRRPTNDRPDIVCRVYPYAIARVQAGSDRCSISMSWRRQHENCQLAAAVPGAPSSSPVSWACDLKQSRMFILFTGCDGYGPKPDPPPSQCRINHDAGGAPAPGPLSSEPHNFTVISFIHMKYTKNENSSHTLNFYRAICT